MSVGSRAEKFNLVSNDHGCMHKCNFSVFDRKFPFWANLVRKIRIVSLAEIGTYTDSNMQNSMVVFTFSVLDGKHPFWANLVQKITIVSLS